MHREVVDDVPLMECAGCHGVWAERGQLARAMRTDEDLRAVFPPDASTEHLCPAGCAARLEEVHYSKVEEHLLLDRCPKCSGIYLDRGELEAVERVNERIRTLFGDGTFSGPPPKRKGVRRFFRRVLGR